MTRASGSFDERLRPIARRLFGYGRALTQDAELASDLYQDTILRAVAARDLPPTERAFRAWLFSIMRNRWIDRLRAERRRPEIESFDEDAHVASMTPVGLESVIVNQLAVRQAFAQLTLAHRDVLSLVDIGGFSYDETASMLGVPRGTVMSRVSRARQALCALLSDDAVAMHPASMERRRT
jgi:RNA polymerase sigma-70 factor (ECF subfamily)